MLVAYGCKMLKHRHKATPSMHFVLVSWLIISFNLPFWPPAILAFCAQLVTVSFTRFAVLIIVKHCLSLVRGLANDTLPSQAGNDGQPIEAQQVSVRVDTQDMTCPNLTTGGDLYALARVRWGCDLWRVLPGKE